MVKDLTQYVQPDFFIDVVDDLSTGNTDREFVAEVVNLKNQLITYGSGLGDFYRLSIETLTEGRGMCGDTSILVASILKAGDSIENYGMVVSFWYCDSDNMANPQTVNHVIVGVEYADGSHIWNSFGSVFLFPYPEPQAGSAYTVDPTLVSE